MHFLFHSNVDFFHQKQQWWKQVKIYIHALLTTKSLHGHSIFVILTNTSADTYQKRTRQKSETHRLKPFSNCTVEASQSVVSTCILSISNSLIFWNKYLWSLSKTKYAIICALIPWLLEVTVPLCCYLANNVYNFFWLSSSVT